MNSHRDTPNASREPQAVRPRSAFTLMEIVLAIGLTSVVMYLLMSGFHLGPWLRLLSEPSQSLH